jgi:hypothetical protein
VNVVIVNVVKNHRKTAVERKDAKNAEDRKGKTPIPIATIWVKHIRTLGYCISLRTLRTRQAGIEKNLCVETALF